MEDKQLTVTMEQIEGYEFLVKFDEGMELLMDEPVPLGDDKGPSASKVISAAVGNCLSASLLFCLQKARVDTHGIKTTVTTRVTRDDKRRLRLDSSHVKININLDKKPEKKINRCIELFEDFCIVTSSVRQGIDVSVEVVDQDGQELYHSGK
jgi:uncharacterized OsmC-like protein